MIIHKQSHTQPKLLKAGDFKHYFIHDKRTKNCGRKRKKKKIYIYIPRIDKIQQTNKKHFKTPKEKLKKI